MFLIVVSSQTGTYMYSNKKLRFKSFSSSRGPRLGHRTGSSMMPKVQAPEMACRKSEAVELAKGYIPPLDTLPTAFSHIHPNFRSARSTSTSCNSALECPHALFSPSKSSLPVESGRTSTFRVLHPLAKYMSRLSSAPSAPRVPGVPFLSPSVALRMPSKTCIILAATSGSSAVPAPALVVLSPNRSSTVLRSSLPRAASDPPNS